ncbi:hypothetical protein BBF96_12940 [Anoxybacter fermentans]|uniref:Phospholipid/glycerol acyltransferase domain-containing protein n=1 Tax=Anoxybacter fermentans TaxID=1323375 RepID=A0A3Q9HRP0_9FIRM|nr:lysophospholipid acyltransferase family protein [Anoxybacter fermentans]AZR74223.1 hypothetical protein BBF96_12940 [Anoxybacter fermentans]
MGYKILKIIADMIIPVFIRLEVINYPELPKDSGALIAVNHIHALDPILISYVLYPTWIHHIAKEEIFRFPFLAPMLNWLGVIPVNRQRPGVNSIKRTIELFSGNKYVCIFPQGTRRKKEFGNIKKGAARLALIGNVPIYPAAITGLEKVRFWGLFKRPKVRIIFGKPISVEKRENTKEEIDILTNELHKSMLDLYYKICY